MEKLSLQQVERIVRTMADVAIANERYFSDLDGVMGDADFGVSLAGGFRAVLGKWDTFDRASIGSFLLNVSTVIVGNTGGSSGPVWGTLFMRCGAVSRGLEEIGIAEIIAMLKSAIQGISARGGAAIGDKTVIDAFNDMVLSLEQSQAEGTDSLLGALERAADAAYETREKSKGWIARRGRQSFTGERSRGTYDPGIVAVGDMARAVVAALKA